jgi:hypothetical protein
MALLHTVLRAPKVSRVIHIDLKRDDCPVMYQTGGNTQDLKKQIAKLRKAMVGMPLGVDPAKELRKSRQQRGLA